MDNQIIFGAKACLAVYRQRPHDIVRIYFGKNRSREIGELLSWAASRKIVYRELGEEELRKVAKSTHHEELVMAAKPLCYKPLPGSGPTRHPQWVALDNVDNPHNLGAILRTCAFFGLEGVLVGGVAAGEKVNGAALRVSEGGAENLGLYAAPKLARELKRFSRQGMAVIGLEAGAGQLLEGGAHDGPWVLVAGHERDGLSPAVRRACTGLYGLGGAGALGSLNVSVAVGVALAEMLRS